MKLNVTSYFKTNILETTSGNFALDLFRFHEQQIGLERILYSVDYPYVTMEQGAQFVDEVLPGALSREDLLRFKRGLAIELLKLSR